MPGRGLSDLVLVTSRRSDGSEAPTPPPSTPARTVDSRSISNTTLATSSYKVFIYRSTTDEFEPSSPHQPRIRQQHQPPRFAGRVNPGF
ncbi:unnamed protein product [Zymoseptoria tritici ST99CH_1A5]|uniref:Uncharacterized protein n=1 Tax=Zymoseptoria tritici ST99CH_1A5 TaxID=1276529 RepID=A0A1Y6M1V0_ZYMTR|nr:unnamed protein product [Zymoseptoria tritici ST99CH_1A5]